MSKSAETKKYMPLVGAAGIGSMLGSGIIIGLSATITVWQSGLGLTDGQVGILSGALTFAIAAGSLLAGNITKLFGLIRSFNMMNLMYLIGAAICVLSGNFPVLLAGLIITGFASGADLPISLTVISHDAPNEKVSASLIASTGILADWCTWILRNGIYRISRRRRSRSKNGIRITGRTCRNRIRMENIF